MSKTGNPAEIARLNHLLGNCARGDVISLGCNDVPSPGGGLYWEDDGAKDLRDRTLGNLSNDAEGSYCR
jgi:hypothetical protein